MTPASTLNTFSSILPHNLRFGRYPTQEDVRLLESEGYRIFVDLTRQECPPYDIEDSSDWIPLPIRDVGVPERMEDVFELMDKLHRVESPIYIHCRGGHDRAPMIAACYLVSRGMTAQRALSEVRAAHSRRTDVKDRWRKLGVPQTKKQISFIHHFASRWKKRVLTAYEARRYVSTILPLFLEGLVPGKSTPLFAYHEKGEEVGNSLNLLRREKETRIVAFPLDRTVGGMIVTNTDKAEQSMLDFLGFDFQLDLLHTVDALCKTRALTRREAILTAAIEMNRTLKEMQSSLREIENGDCGEDVVSYLKTKAFGLVQWKKLLKTMAVMYVT